MLKFFDGAYGTYYYELTHDRTPCENANLTNKDCVLAIHKEYIAAGANYIKTNTFNTTDINVIKEGFLIAKKAAEGTNAVVFADIGYIDDDSGEGAAVKYKEKAAAFIELGAKCFLFETLCEYDVIIPAVDFIKQQVPNASVMVSFAVFQEGYTKKGHYYKTLLSEAAQNRGIDIIGLNCGCGPTHLLNLIKNIDIASFDKPFAVMPNSGYPSLVNGRTFYEDNAEYFAQKAEEIYRLGVGILGGCCGTTPKHIEEAVRLTQKAETSQNENKPKKQASSAVYNSNACKLEKKELAIELDPPKDCDFSHISAAVDKLKKCGVTTVTFADSPLAKSRADSIMTAAKIRREKGIDVLPHLTCRDKNYIAIRGGLLGASFEGVNKVLVVTGDPVPFDGHKRTGVFNFNSIELISYIGSLNKELFSNNPFEIYGAININARNFDIEMSRGVKKLENGATYLFSQPILSDTAAYNFIKAKKTLNCKLFAGILPFSSYKNAVFLNNEVPGIDIPQEIIDGIKDKKLAEVHKTSIGFCTDIIRNVYDYADGFYIMTPLNNVDLVCGLINGSFETGELL